MRIVIITGADPEHRYVANAILKAADVSCILVCDPPVRRTWKTVLKRSVWRFIDKSLRTIFLRMINDARTRTESLRRVLGPTSDAFAQPELVRIVGRPGDGRLATEITAIAPDIIAVYGTGIIPEHILGSARKIALNMHTGMSPWYRGVAGALWPLIDRRPDMIGATVHECTAEIDGGRIFFRQPAQLAPCDNVHAVFGRAVIVGAAGYAKVLTQTLDGELSGMPQDLSLGKEYRGTMLGLVAELRARHGLRSIHRTAS